MRSLVLLMSLVLAGGNAGADFCLSAHGLNRLLPAASGAHGEFSSGGFNAQRLRDRNFRMTDFRSLQDAWLTNVSPVGSRRDMFRAELQGHAVVGKLLPHRNLKEAAWLQELNHLGLGPKIHGIVERNHEWYVIMADVGGVNTQLPMAAPTGFSLNARVITEMKRQTRILLDHGIFPLDLQFQVSHDLSRVTLIDPQMFSLRDSAADLEFQGRIAIETILRNWQLDGRYQGDEDSR